MRDPRQVAQRPGQGHHSVGWDAADAVSTIVTVHVPLAYHQCRGRKMLVSPARAGQEPLGPPRAPAHTRGGATAAVRALARAFRWRGLLETGAVATVKEIAAAESINPSYVSRVLRLTLLSPENVGTVVAGVDEGGAAMLDRLMLPFPIDWVAQALLGDTGGSVER